MWRTIKNIFGMLLIAGSVYLFAKSYQASYMYKKSLHETIWLTEYADAIKQAKKEHKYIFVDIGAPFCSICKAIDKQLLSNNNVVQSLKKFIPVKIDGSNESHTIHTHLRKQFKIMGVPAFLIINPFDEQEVKRWGGELYDVSADDFVDKLNSYANVPFEHMEQA